MARRQLCATANAAGVPAPSGRGTSLLSSRVVTLPEASTPKTSLAKSLVVAVAASGLLVINRQRLTTISQ